ncbi:hypothetical protein SynBIOSE41_01131 [Synechococcus sp. BIOS-E4-1]|nr:hypothetical protein SynBIOSE41_01131 [Synechococcus sp. BIOS-E4-1]
MLLTEAFVSDVMGLNRLLKQRQSIVGLMHEASSKAGF